MRLVALAPYGLFAYPLVGLALARSEVAIVFHRYSPFLAAMLVACFGVYLGMVAARMRHNHVAEQLCLLALAAATLSVTGSNAGQRLAGITLVLPTVRLLAGVALFAREALPGARSRRPIGVFVSAAMLLALFGLLDLGIAALTRAQPQHAQTGVRGFRHAYDLRTLPTDAVVIVGDSFVWGQGVQADETFGARLEQRYAASGKARKVYSLGEIGGDVASYITALGLVPESQRVDRIVLAYYVNDMPPRARAIEALRNQLIALGVGAPTLRLIADSIGRLITPTLAEYNAAVIRDYDPHEPSYAARLELLRERLAAFHRLAQARSQKPPFFLLLPLVVDFRKYPLEQAHGVITELARREGYEVLDLLPAFRRELGDGTKHLVSKNDNHFDAGTHALVARVLEARL